MSKKLVHPIAFLKRISLVIVFLSSIGSLNASINGGWSTLATGPVISRSCVAYAKPGGNEFVYSFGGGATSALLEIRRYSVSADIWSVLGASLNLEVNAGTAISFGDTAVFVFGGDLGSGTLGSTQKLNLSTNAVTTLAAMPIAVTDFAAVKYADSLVYVIGGDDGFFGSNQISDVQVYNVKTNSWSTATNYPIVISKQGFGISGNTIVSAAGWSAGNAVANAYTGTIDQANPALITWTPIASYPTGGVYRPASYFVQTTSGIGGVFLAGGADAQNNILSASYIYNAFCDQWEALPSIAVARSNFKASGPGDSRAWICSGYTGVADGTSERLDVTSLTSSSFAQAICSNQTYTFNGVALNTAGVYKDTLVADNGCDSVITLTLTVNPAPVVNLGGPYSQCGSVVLDAGNLGSTYLWSDNSTAQTLTVTSTNTYTVTVTNPNNACFATASAFVNIFPVSAITLNDVTQCGGTTVLDASNNAFISYEWSDGSTTSTITVSTSGNYIVTAIDDAGCSSIGSANVYLKPTPVVVLGNNVTQCGGSVTLDAGNPGDMYAWSDGSNGQILVATSSNDYSVTVTDVNSGCSASGTISITIFPAPIVDLGQAVSQCGGSLTLSDFNAADHPGATYAWSNGSTTSTSSVSSSGTYSVTALLNGCSASASVNVYINPVPVVNLGPDITQCGGSVVLDAGTSGDTYVWQDLSTNQTLTVSATGNYSVTVTNSNSGCSMADNIDVTINALPLVVLGPDITQCGGSVTLQDLENPTGITYLWSDNSANTTLVVTVSGDYRVTETDANGCSGTGTIHVTINPIPSLGPDQKITVCPGTTVDLVALYPNNNYEAYTWSNPAPTIAGFGSDTLVVITAAGCTDTVVVTIDTFTTPNLGADFADSICIGQVYNLTTHFPNIGYTSYIWSTPNPYAATAGSYILTVTGSNGCSDVAVTNISNKIQPQLGADIVDSICVGYTKDLTFWFPASAYSVYNWTPNIPDSTKAGAGIYVLTVAYYQGGCTDDVTVSIITKDQPIVTLDPMSNLCVSEKAFVLAGGLPIGGSYYIDGVSQTSFDPAALRPGVHRVNYEYTNISGCTDSASRLVEIYPLPVPTTTALPDVCSGSPVINLNNFFSPTGGVFSGQGVSLGYFYPSIGAIGINQIMYLYTDTNGCSDTVSNTISVKKSVDVSLTTSDVDFTICRGDAISFTAIGAEFYEFFVNGVSQGQASTTNIFTTQSLGNHDEIYVVGSNSCSVDTSESIIIDVITLPTVYAGEDTTITLGDPIVLNTKVTGSSLLLYDWTPASYLNFPNVPNPTYVVIDTVTFLVTVTDIWGCKGSDDITVNVLIPDNILLPNFLTPDGDGKNDQWILNSKIHLEGSNLVIFNRWGETVYEVSNYPNNWDGTYKATGKKLPDDTYYYVLKVPLQHNHIYKGAINILNSPAK